MTADLTARVAELASLIGANLAEDEAVALACADNDGNLGWRDSRVMASLGDHTIRTTGSRPVARIRESDSRGDESVPRILSPAAVAAHIVRNDPARRLRDVKATRDLVAEILTEGHYYAEVGYYSCSQAREGFGLASGLTGPPGSGCSDPERAGQPCDCGRDWQVARLLGIIAREWESDSTDD
jgi:hypothetical protein